MLKVHILKDAQKGFLAAFDPGKYHENMRRVFQPNKKKPKPKEDVLAVMEQYDFYFHATVLNELTKD